PAALTPFDETGAVDTAALARNTDWVLEQGAAGVVGTGTMGEAQSLSPGERRLVLETLVEAVAGRATVTAGVSSETPATSIGYAADAAAAGAEALMLLPALGYEGDAREIEAFYRAVAESTDLPIMAYNNPKASGIDMRPELIARLAEIDGVVAVKECSGDARRISEILNATEEFEVLVGGDDWALEGLCAGAVGWVAGVANVAPRECVELQRLCGEGRLGEARELYSRLLPLGRLDMRPKLVQFFKAAMDLVGRDGGACRPPRLALTDAERQEVEKAVAALGARVAG
ncbi:MAG TPA: dihydrodipicolinate synthase family protein, partial [Thermoleophilaceae bacterium]|nr:dihydrodipicolinate synthase family protein [Thermoleophilaceae bacterium]